MILLKNILSYKNLEFKNKFIIHKKTDVFYHVFELTSDIQNIIQI